MTEKEIIEGCLKRKVACQEMLFNRYSGRLMTLCNRYCCSKYEAEDVLQEAFIKIFKNIHQYKFQGSFEGWMKKIAVNCALKKVSRKRIIYDQVPEDMNTAPIETEALRNLSEKELLQLIAALPDGYRLIFNLYVIEGYTHEEIAVMLKIKTVTSRSQLLKAKRMLQQKIIVINKVMP